MEGAGRRSANQRKRPLLREKMRSSASMVTVQASRTESLATSTYTRLLAESSSVKTFRGATGPSQLDLPLQHHPLPGPDSDTKSEKGAPETENHVCIGFTVLRGGLRPWSQIMALEGARPSGPVEGFKGVGCGGVDPPLRSAAPLESLYFSV